MLAVPDIESGRPGWLLPTTMPIAPAATALACLVVKGHVPRSTNAHLPATDAALVYAVQPSVVVGPGGLAASVATTMVAVTGVVVKAGPNAAGMAVHGPAAPAGAV